VKIRNGFVSNSSSTSFILAYDKKSVMTDPRDIVDFIDNNLRNEIYFRTEMCDGEDLFALDTHQKNYLLKHKKRFIKYNDGTELVTDYTGDPDENGNYPKKEVPHVTAITRVFDLFQDPWDFVRPEVDMSDIPEVEITNEEINRYYSDKENNPDIKKKIDESMKRDNIRYQREHELRDQKRQEAMDKVTKQVLYNNVIDPEDLVVEQVWIDNDSCDPDGTGDYQFPERYFGLEEDTYYEPIGDPDLDEEEEE